MMTKNIENDSKNQVSDDEFFCDESEAYCKEIEKFENGNLENVSEVTLVELKRRMSELEKGI